jgi:peptidoglycan hydrolase CwlO-like protein
MNKWLSIVIIVVLVAATGTTVFLYSGKSNDLNAANSEIAIHQTAIAGLNSDISASKAETTDYQSQLKAAQDAIMLLDGNITDLNNQNIKLTSDIATANTDISDTKFTLANTQSSISSIQSSLISAQNNVLTLNATVKKVTDPRHFASLQELTDWLQQDDTDTKYPAINNTTRAYILQVRALRDGFILAVSIWVDASGGWVSNRAVIGAAVYAVNAKNDSVSYYGGAAIMPSHPEPLP